MLWITAVWGGCSVAIRWGLRDAPVLWFATLRSVVAGPVPLAIGVAQRRPHPVGTRPWSLIGLLALSNSSVAFAPMSPADRLVGQEGVRSCGDRRSRYH